METRWSPRSCTCHDVMNGGSTMGIKASASYSHFLPVGMPQLKVTLHSALSHSWSNTQEVPEAYFFTHFPEVLPKDVSQ